MSIQATETHHGAQATPVAAPVVSQTSSQDNLDARRMEGLGGLLFLVSTRKWLLAGAALCSIVGVALGLVPFFCIALIATAIFSEPPRLEEVRTLAFVALGSVALRYVFTSIANVMAHIAAFRLQYDLRMRFAKKLGDVPLSFFASRTTGELKRTMMDDVGQIEGFIAHYFPDGVAAFTVPIGTAIALFAIDWRMALASIAVAPIAVVIMGVGMNGIENLYKDWHLRQDRTNNAVLEFLRGIHVIKTFGITAKSFGELAESIRENLRWVEDLMRRNGNTYSVFTTLISSSHVVLVPLGGFFYLDGSLTLPDLVLFLVLGPQLLASTTRVVYAWENIKKINEGTARIAKVLLAPDLVERNVDGRPRDIGIAFRDVSFRYTESTEILSKISFEAPAGKVTALVGPSGAGKTTIARLVPRLWEVSSGRVELGGVNVQEIQLDELLSRISIVFQDVFLFYGTVKDNLRLGKPDATDAEIIAACKAARAHDFIAALPNGYDTLLGERGARLSGGEKQRLSIARALLKDAPILILDEASAFTDAENEALIQDALSDLCRGRTVLVIAHRLSTISTADKIVVLEKGRVVDQGTHDELLARCALYGKLWSHHTAALGWTLDSHGAPANEVAR